MAVRLRHIIVAVIAVMGLGVLVFYALPPLAEVVSTNLNDRRVPVYKVERDDMKMAVSIDATWGVDYTDDILDLFDQMDMKTTFFLAGYWIEKYPDYVKKIHDRGHEIGNHSYGHPHMNGMSRQEIIDDLTQNHNLLKEITDTDSSVFRPPFGEYSNKVIEAAESLGYMTVQWSIDSLDWKDVSAEFMVRRVMDNAGPGEIVLFHNAGTHTLEALREILPRLKEEGYEVVPVSDVLYKENYMIEPHSGLQRKIQEKQGEEGVGVGVSVGPGGAPAPSMLEPVRKVDDVSGYIALTINVDWGNEELEDMLDILDTHEVKATFFPTGRWAQAFPDDAAEIARRGHEIGSHGMKHDMPTTLSDTVLHEHIAAGKEAIEKAIGTPIVPLYAPPAGDVNDRVVRQAAALDMWTTLWTYDTIDWQDPAPSVIIQRIVPRAESGGIVLMHPKSVTVQALSDLIKGLREKGLEPIPLWHMMQSSYDPLVTK